MFVNFVNVSSGTAWPSTLTVTPFRYLYNCTPLFLSIALLISGLSTSLSAPANFEADWLSNPCSKQPPIRHGRSPAENQLRIFINYIDSKFIKELKALYNPAPNTTMKGNCPKVNNWVKPIKTAETKTMATEAFYDSLLQLAVFIDKLKDIPIKTTGEFNYSKRKYIFEEAKENLRLVICEFNDTLSKYDDRIIQPNRPKVPKTSLKCLPKTLDLTMAHLLDTDFFKKIKKFLKQSRRLLKRKKSKKPKVDAKSESNNKKRTKKLKQ